MTKALVIVIASAVALAAIIFLSPPARTAERTLPGEYEINIYARNYSETGPSIIPLKDGRHESREACRHAIMFVKIRESGAKLRCDPVEQTRVR